MNGAASSVPPFNSVNIKVQQHAKRKSQGLLSPFTIYSESEVYRHRKLSLSPEELSDRRYLYWAQIHAFYRLEDMFFCSVIPDANRSSDSDSISGIMSIIINKNCVPLF